MQPTSSEGSAATARPVPAMPDADGIAAPPPSLVGHGEPPPLTLEEFRAVYREQMRAKHDLMQQRLAREKERLATLVPPSPAPPVPGPHAVYGQMGAGVMGAQPHAAGPAGVAAAAQPVGAAPPVAGPAPRALRLPADLLAAAIPGLVNLALACLVFSQGNTGNFTYWFVCLGALQLAMWLLSRIKINWRRTPVPQNGDAAGAPAAPPRGVMQRGRLYLFAYIAFRCVTTFFVSMFPSFRVEALEKELRDDGLAYDDAERAAARLALHLPVVDGPQPEEEEEELE